MINAPPTLLTRKDISATYGFGRDLSTRLSQCLPHIVLGRCGRGERRRVRREDIDRLIELAAQRNTNLWELVKEYRTPDALKAWMEQPDPPS